MINALYVSNALIYKNQWDVISAISKIRQRYNINLKLTIVGGGSGFALQKMKFSKFKYDRKGKFIKLDEFVDSFYKNGSDELFKLLKEKGLYPYSDLDREPVI